MYKTTAIQVASNCSEQELENFAKTFAKTLKGNEKIFLEGELGAGKSTFARALLLALDSKSLSQGSPTYPIIHSYELSLGSVHHMDLYRIKMEEELQERGIEELLDSNSVCVVEWASLFADWKQKAISALLPKHRCFEVKIVQTADQSELREIILYKLF